MKAKAEQLFLSIGLMSGTSMDGIDAALLETDGLHHIKELAHASLSYDPSYKILLKAAELATRLGLGNLEIATTSYTEILTHYLREELKQPNPKQSLQMLEACTQGNLSLTKVIQLSTQLHAKLVKQLIQQAGLRSEQIDVVGYHGQVLLHQPSEKISVIVGDGQVLADEVGITVINDFRSNDIAHGGQGAPFAPLYHFALSLRDQHIPVVVVNCGGIANITLIPNENPDDLIAFDTGPGNGLVDRFVRQRTAGKEHMDANGQYGRMGKVHSETLKALFEKSLLKNQQNYFSVRPPKALDSGDPKLIPELDNLSLEDGCRTLEAFTADSIVQSLNLLKINPPLTWILAGGGWNNPVILQELKERLAKKLGKELRLLTAKEAGWNSQALEAQIFAYLAVRSLKHLPLSMPGTTGVSIAASGGKIQEPRIS